MTDLPEDVRARAEELTQRARGVDDEAAAESFRERRDELLDDHGYSARVREGDETLAGSQDTGPDREVLVLYPDDWLDDDTIRTDRIEDLDRATEIPLTGPGDPDDWDAVAEHNRTVAARVRDRHGEVHGENAAAFADFMSNHYAKRIERATDTEIEVFVEEYFPRNAWPSEEQRELVEESVAYATSADVKQ